MAIRLFDEPELERIHLANRTRAALASQPLYRTIVRLQALGVLMRPQDAVCRPDCRSKGFSRSLQTRRRSTNANTECFAYRCNTCNKTTALMQNSFFNLFRKPLEILVQMIKCWAAGIGVERAEAILQFTEKTTLVTKIYARLNQIVAYRFNSYGILLGKFNALFSCA